jgi:hypothetical protein
MLINTCSCEEFAQQQKTGDDLIVFPSTSFELSLLIRRTVYLFTASRGRLVEVLSTCLILCLRSLINIRKRFCVDRMNEKKQNGRAVSFKGSKKKIDA